MPWKGSLGSSGTANESAESPARQAVPATSDVLLRTVNGSSRQTHTSISATSSAPSGSSSRNCGNVSVRKRNVSGSTIAKSKKLSVAQVTLILNHDSAITTQTSSSDSAAAMAGRRKTTSQEKLSH